jgi:hypothetical protein
MTSAQRRTSTMHRNHPQIRIETRTA